MDLDFLKRKPKEDLSEEQLLKEIEAETGVPAKKEPARPLPPPPIVNRPVSAMPMPSTQQPQLKQEMKTPLSEQQVAQLPLFMKIDEYEKIVAGLDILVNSLKKMDEILNNLTDLEKRESEETAKWRNQLEITKNQLAQLLRQMPETGRLKNMLEIKKKQQQTEKIKKEVSGLRQDLQKVSAPAPKKSAEQLSSEIQDLRSSISFMQQEMRGVYSEIKGLAEIAKQKIEEKNAEKENPKLPYQKTIAKRPW